MSSALAAWARIVHRWPWPVLAGSSLLLALSVLGVLRGGQLSSTSGYTGPTPSSQAARLIAAQLPSQQPSGASFLLVFTDPRLEVESPTYRAALEAAVAPLARDPRVAQVVTPYGLAGPERARVVSRDGHSALVQVVLRSSGSAAQAAYPGLRAEVHPGPLQVQATGSVALDRAFSTTLEGDLRRAETVSLPVTAILLLLIFASAVAALLPLGVGVLTILGGLGGTYLLAHATTVSQYALNIVTLVGLGVSIDYSLFIVSRFREELGRGSPRPEALATALATAGRAITFSGVTVAIGLGALLFYQGTFMASMGAAGAMVVLLAIVYALTFLPAVLALLGPRVDALRLPGLLPRAGGGGLWRRVADWAMERPLAVLLPSTAVLLLMGSPILGIRLATGGVELLPPQSQARQGYETLTRDFPDQGQDSFTVVVDYPRGSPLEPTRVGRLYDLSRRIAAVPGVSGVSSPVNLGGGLGRSDYQRLYAQPADRLPAAVRAELRTTVGAHIAVLTATTPAPASSQEAHQILRRLRALHVAGATVLVGGAVASDQDTVDYILGRTPAAIGFVIGVTLLVLFLLTGSVALPIKAVLTNLVSVSASFGALVWVFQQGHLSQLLNFTPQPIDPAVLVIMFAAVFGLSMDYEVLLVSRIQEEQQRTAAVGGAIAAGLERSARLITGAAAIMVAVFVSFGLAEIVLIKAIGLGLALAVALDATVVRALVVPSIMRLLGRANWWAPPPLRRLYHRLGTGEVTPPRARAA
jgi:RND superfamily putative drug exporter